MPKAITADRRHEDFDERDARGVFGRVLGWAGRSPKDSAAVFMASAAIAAILINALFLQTGRHPSPLFGMGKPQALSAAGTASPLPRARPPEADRRGADAAAIATRPAPQVSSPSTAPAMQRANVAPTAKPEAGKNEGSKNEGSKSEASRSDPLGDLIAGNRRLSAVQRALADNGYGQVKATGVMNAETKAAIERFERERKLPVTGQVSDRLLREITVVTGRAID